MFWEFIIFTLSALIAYDVWLNRRAAAKLQNIKMVSRIPIIGSALMLSSFQPHNLHLKFTEFVHRFGKTFFARVFGMLIVVTAEPKYVDQLLSSQKHISKSLVYMLLSSWLGNGLLLANGESWQKMRKIITPTFHFKILEQFVEIFDRNCDILVEKLRKVADGKTIVNIYPYMELLTLDVVAETAMGVNVNAQLNEKSDFVHAVKEVTNIVATRFIRPHLTPPIFFHVLAPRLYKAQIRGTKLMHEFTNNIITERRKVLEASRDAAATQKHAEEEEFGIKRRMALLDVLLQSTIDDKPITDKQIRDEVNTFMFEGHDTTTSAISYCLYLISRHRECQQKLLDEIRGHFGDDLHRAITYADLQNLNYLNCVVKESLRLYPSVPAIGRYIKEDFKIGDIIIPGNTQVLILLWSVLRDPNVFSEPNKFIPERHYEETTASNSYTNIPFSAGPRNCIGQKFALLEIRAVVIKMLRNFELLPLGPNVEPSIKIVMRSKSGINFGLRPRENL